MYGLISAPKIRFPSSIINNPSTICHILFSHASEYSVYNDNYLFGYKIYIQFITAKTEREIRQVLKMIIFYGFAVLANVLSDFHPFRLHLSAFTLCAWINKSGWSLPNHYKTIKRISNSKTLLTVIHLNNFNASQVWWF